MLRDPSGGNPRLLGEPQAGLRSPTISPDGRQTAFVSAEAGTDDIWVHDIERDRRWRVTFDSAAETYPVWSPQGDRIVFASNRKGSTDLYVKNADGVGDTKELIVRRGPDIAYEWSRRGRLLFLGRPHNWLILFRVNQPEMLFEKQVFYEQRPFSLPLSTKG